MIKRDIDYWMKDIELGQMRGEIIITLDCLRSYKEQECLFVRLKLLFPKQDQEGYGIHWILRDAMDFLFDDYCLYLCVEKNVILYESIGYTLKTNKEAELLYELAFMLEKVQEKIDPFDRKAKNEEYLKLDELYELRKLSEETYQEFMKNEKNNKNFTQYMRELEERRDREYEEIRKHNLT